MLVKHRCRQRRGKRQQRHDVVSVGRHRDDDYLAKVCPGLFSNTRKEEKSENSVAMPRQAWQNEVRKGTSCGTTRVAQRRDEKAVRSENIGEEAAGTDGTECPMLMGRRDRKIRPAIKPDTTRYTSPAL
ncbi:hypothetical protein ERJ75_001155200 [Trypanosoma vivax]|nr:hypothetical protein ERJ75_001155200 [Trypanosoma vivax]